VTLSRTAQVNRTSSIINFGIGQPGFDLLPLDLMRRAAAARFAEGDTDLLNYGYEQGDGHFRHALADFLTVEYATPVMAEQLMVTAGASQALSLICTLFTKPGDTVFIEEPSYFLALRILREDFGLNAVPIPIDENGLRVDALEEALARQRPVFIYTIPTFQNPTGYTLSPARRERLVTLAAEHGFLVVADEVYQSLHYTASPPKPLAAYTESGTVLSIGSFSKILAPGLRLGWIQAAPELVQRFVTCGLVDSGGGLNHFTSNLVRVALERGWQADYLAGLRETYRQRIAVMDAALHRHVGDLARWRKPDGGYFFWLEMDGANDTAALLSAAHAANVGFLPGARCSSVDGLGNCLRLSFAHFGEAEIEKGIAQLGQVMGQ
jgi:2-aminoadipate transaminase